jgi:hypothetical protein
LEQKDFNNQSNYKKINKLTLLSYHFSLCIDLFKKIPVWNILLKVSTHNK